MQLVLIALFCFVGLVSGACQANTKCAKNGTCSSCSIMCDAGSPCCGNGVCDTWEDCTSCPTDCGNCATCDNICGNHLCDLNENGCNCPQDCGPCCCDGQCLAPETFATCPGECGGAIGLRAIDALSGVALASASVNCVSGNQLSTVITIPNKLTDSNGHFFSGFLEPNTYTCTVSVPGYYSNSAALVASPGGRVYVPAIVPLQLFTLGTVSGFVRHSIYNSWLRNANVSCQSVTYQRDAIASSFGYFEIHDLTPGTYSCTGSLPGYQSESVSVVVGPNLNPQITILLVPLPAAISITVVDEMTGLAITNATVSCGECIKGTSLGTFVSGTDGHVLFTGVSAERASTAYVCNFLAQGYFSTQERYELVRGMTTLAVVQLQSMN